LEGAPQTLPGPEAAQWIEWACGLQEPQDAESLQTLRNGFVHLDDFVANLEPNMWVAAGPPTSGIPPEPKRSADKAPSKEPSLEAKGFDEPVVPPMEIASEATKSSGGYDEPRFPELLEEQPPRVLESNTLTPNDDTAPLTEEAIQRIMVQERALLAGMMGLVTDPLGHFNRPAERPFTEEVLRGTSAAPASVADPLGHFNRPVERSSAAEEASRETSAGPASLVSEPIDHFSRPAERPSTAEVLRETSAASAILVSEPVDQLSPLAELPFTAEVSRETSAAPATTSDIRARVGEAWSRKWRTLLATPATLVFAAVLLFAVLGALLWRTYRNRTSNGPVNVIESKIPDQTLSNPGAKGLPTNSGMSTNSATHTLSPKTQTEEQAKLQAGSVAPKQLSKSSPAKQAGKREDEVLRPPVEVPTNIAVVKNEGGPPNATTEIPVSIPGGVPNGVPNSVANIAKDIPVAVPKLAPQKVRVSSGVAQGLLIHQVSPKYPPQAQEARIQGTVVLQAVIGKDGTVQNVHVVSGHPMLTQAAMDAVRMWRYKPYTVNGEAVEADTQINVNFKLSGE
ncbi:MAG: TonB family protein, partial [Candidatus Korobacteraceae bacterium]